MNYDVIVLGSQGVSRRLRHVIETTANAGYAVAVESDVAFVVARLASSRQTVVFVEVEAHHAEAGKRLLATLDQALPGCFAVALVDGPTGGTYRDLLAAGAMTVLDTSVQIFPQLSLVMNKATHWLERTLQLELDNGRLRELLATFLRELVKAEKRALLAEDPARGGPLRNMLLVTRDVLFARQLAIQLATLEIETTHLRSLIDVAHHVKADHPSYAVCALDFDDKAEAAIAACRQLRALFPTAPLVALLGYDPIVDGGMDHDLGIAKRIIRPGLDSESIAAEIAPVVAARSHAAREEQNLQAFKRRHEELLLRLRETMAASLQFT